MTTRMIRLGDFCHQDRTTVRPGERPDLRYIGLETIESGTGQFQDGELSKTPDVPQANSFHFGPEHVLYGKLRPYLNKVALPEFEGKCSTEIIPFRPDAALDRRYLAYFLRSADTVAHISERTAGARMPRADMDFVLGLQLPLPSLDEQRRISDLLSRAEGIVRLRREAEKKAAEIIPALFLDMFGEPATNPKGWKVVKIGELAALVTSGSTPRGGAEVYVDDGPYFIRSQNVLMNELVLSDAARIPRSVHKQMSRTKVQAGDVLLNITGASIGRVAWVDALDQEANVNQHVCIIRVKPELVVPAFLSVCLSLPFNQMMINTVQAGASRQALNHEQVRGIKIGLPPTNVQRSFSDRIASVLSITTQQETALNRAQATFNALLARVFSEGDRQTAVNTVDRMTLA